MPPLRERGEDVGLLVAYFIAKFNERFNRTVRSVQPAAMAALMSYEWPGNVRQLESVLKSAFVLGRGRSIRVDDLPAEIRSHPGETKTAGGERGMRLPTLHESHGELLRRALKATGGNKTRAAALLGISRPTLYKMMAEHGVAADSG
jgi:DNA-binding NtrC family response regulator